MYLALSYPFDIRDLSAEQLQYILKIVLLRVCGDYIDHVWNKFPEHIKTNLKVHFFEPIVAASSIIINVATYAHRRSRIEDKGL
ncbi:hypothetical protein P5V15_010145 [Pogonomyrmex californicus]